MTKDDFLVTVKLSTGIEMKLGNEYYFGDKIGITRPVEFMENEMIYEYYDDNLESRLLKRKRFTSYDQLMECVNHIIEMIPDKIHYKWMRRP